MKKPETQSETAKHVICAIRGGLESRATASRAIDLALEDDARLTFFHVVDAEFLGTAATDPLHLGSSTLVEMAMSAMLGFCEQAQRRGVITAEAALRKGNTCSELRRLAEETEAERLVIGSPRQGSDRNVFGMDELDIFLAGLSFAGDLYIIQGRSAEGEEG
jgi:nucleotide-binding universal stress UspA family protein